MRRSEKDKQSDFTKSLRLSESLLLKGLTREKNKKYLRKNVNVQARIADK